MRKMLKVQIRQMVPRDCISLLESSAWPSLKLRVFLAYKLLAHNRAAYHGTIRQLSQAAVLQRAIHSLEMWTEGSWKEWCEDLGEHELGHFVPPAVLKLDEEHQRMNTAGALRFRP